MSVEAAEEHLAKVTDPDAKPEGFVDAIRGSSTTLLGFVALGLASPALGETAGITAGTG